MGDEEVALEDVRGKIAARRAEPRDDGRERPTGDGIEDDVFREADGFRSLVRLNSEETIPLHSGARS